MAVGLSCAFLLTIAALLLRFGIPRSDRATLANLKWFVLGLTVMFAFLALMGLGGMGSKTALKDARRIQTRAELERLGVGAPVLLETTISKDMPVDDHGWVASKSVGSSTGATPALVAELSDGRMALSGESYSDVDWSLDDAGMHVFLQRGDPITLLGKVAKGAGLEVQTVFSGHRAEGVQKKARLDYFIYAVGALTSLASCPGVALLLLLAGRRRRRELEA